MNALAVRLRPARREDLDAIIALDRATELAPHWPVAAYTAILDASNTGSDHLPLRCLIVAEPVPTEEAAPHVPIVGFAVALMPPALRRDEGMPRVAELEDVVVAVTCRGVGIGRALCGAVLDWCRTQGATEVALEVRAANAPAIALYTQLGFEQAGRRPAYYREPEDDAIVMRMRRNSSAA